jgi:cytochrome P450
MRNRASLARLRSEVLAHFGTETKPHQPINFVTLKACKYLQWVLMETNRLYPAGPLNARTATEDTMLPVGGPQGTQVKFCNYLTHREKSISGDDAWEFRPERWENRRHGWE